MPEASLAEPNIPVGEIHLDLLVILLWTPAICSPVIKYQLQIKAERKHSFEKGGGGGEGKAKLGIVIHLGKSSLLKS